MATITTNTTITLPAGQMLVFGLGGSATAIIDGNVYDIGQGEKFFGPFTANESVQVVVRDGTITYNIESDGAASREVTQNPITRQLTSEAAEAVRGAVGAVYVTATPNQDCLADVTEKLAKIKASGGGTLIFPFIGGGGYKTSGQIKATGIDNLTIVLMDDLAYTGTSRIDSVLLVEGTISPADYCERPALISYNNAKIDANGRNIVGYVHPTPGQPGTMVGVHFRYCKDIEIRGIYVYNGIAGGLMAQYCIGGTIADCSASDVLYDNGIYIYNNGEHYGSISDTTPDRWANIHVVNAKAWNCANHGIGVYGAVGCTFDNPKVWNCGNNTVNGPDGFPRAAGPAGGIGLEFDSNTDPNALLNYRLEINNPQVTGSFGFGIRTNCKGTKINGGFVRGTKIPTNHTDDATVPIWGSGVFVQTAGEADITGSIKIENSERHGLRIQGNSVGAKYPSVTFDGEITGSGSEAVQAIGVTLVSISPTSIIRDNGQVAGGKTAVNISNQALNSGNGTVILAGRYDNNGGSLASLAYLGTLDLTRGITGHNNSGQLASAFHAIYVPQVGTIHAANIQLTSTNAKQARILKVDASTKAVVDRQSILGDQTNATQPRAEVVSTTFIGNVISTAAPATAPAYIGQQWLKTDTGTAYIAKGQSGASDWVALN